MRPPVARPSLAAAALAAAALPAAAAAAPAQAKPRVHTVKPGPFRVQVQVQGVLEADAAAGIAVRPKVWSTLRVKRAAPHGARVRKGEVVLELETEALDRAIADQERANRAEDLAIEAAELALHQAERALALDLAAAERARARAEQDLARWQKVGRGMEEKSARFLLKQAEQYLESELEELKQLEKMYEADELTEETEEIVLKRQRNRVEAARFNLEKRRHQSDETLRVTIPRRDAALREAAKRAALAWERAREELPRNVKKQRAELERMKVERDRSREKLARLRADRKALTVRAPIDGIVYYGAATRGEWGDAAQAAAKLRPGASVIAGSVLMTIVKPRPLHARAGIPEAELHRVRPGVKGTAKPAGFPALRIPAFVRRVDPIPSKPGTFDARIDLALPRGAEALVPGMHVAITLVPYERADAIAVPAEAVSADPRDPARGRVTVIGKDGKPAERAVRLGRRAGGRVEILEGLRPGERVRLPAAAAKGGEEGS